MSGNHHAIVEEGDSFLFYAYFRRYDTGALVSPGTVTFSYRSPAQAEAAGTTTSAITATSTGYFVYLLNLPTPGLWRGEFRAAATAGLSDLRVPWTVEVVRSPVRVA